VVSGSQEEVSHPQPSEPRRTPLSAAARAADPQDAETAEGAREREHHDQINIRASVSDLDRVVEWCERNRSSYREGFGELVKLIDKA
jgi:hypothetical protein